jgi:hypothetical protein
MKKQDDLKERTKQFALRIIRLFSSLPKTAEAQVLGKQLLRSGTSVSRTKQIRVRREMRRFSSGTRRIGLLAGIARRWSDIPSGQTATLATKCDELTAIFVTIIKQVRDEG